MVSRKSFRRKVPKTRTAGRRQGASVLQSLLSRHPELEVIEVLFTDINGIVRGKRVARGDFAKVFDPGINLPGANALLDCKGMNFSCVTNGGADGDPDMICRPVEDTLVMVPWAERPTAQVLVGMYDGAAQPYFADPRHVLARALAPFKTMGLTPVVAIELEFYLLQADDGLMPAPKLGRIPGTGLEQTGPQYNCLENLAELDNYFAQVDAACRVQGIPASAALAEFAAGQFEINLHHVADPLLACAHAVMLKRAVKGVARKHGLGASFMAKPFADSAGSGLHVHVSLLDRQGNNIFAPGKRNAGSATISDNLRHAIGGLALTMQEAMAIFAPNANSYRRLRPASFVPLAPNWGINHRGLAIRIPLSARKDSRLEHRVAGADANPYLVVAALLAGIHHGLSNHCDPGPMIPTGTVIEETIVLPQRWERALELFQQSTILPRYLGEEFCRVYALCRREECDRFHAEVSRQDYDWYLRNV